MPKKLTDERRAYLEALQCLNEQADDCTHEIVDLIVDATDGRDQSKAGNAALNAVIEMLQNAENALRKALDEHFGDDLDDAEHL